MIAFSTPTTFDESMEIEKKVDKAAKAKEEEFGVNTNDLIETRTR